MPTIVSIILAGGLGGLISTLLPTGTDVPFPSVLQAPLEKAPWYVRFIGHLVISVIVGAFVAAVLWAAVDPTATNLTSTKVQPKQLATAAAIGLAGIAIAKKLQQQAEEAADWKASFAQTRSAAIKLKEKEPI